MEHRFGYSWALSYTVIFLRAHTVAIDLERFSKPNLAIVPIVDKESIYLGRRFQANTENGWYQVELGDQVKILNKVDEIDIDKIMENLPLIRGYTLADSIVPLHFDSVKFRYGYSESVPVHFIASQLWDIVKTRRWEDGRLFYQGLDYSSDTSVVEKVRERLETEKPLKGIKGLTPELRYVYLVLRLQRDNYRALEELKKLKLSKEEKEKRLQEFQETLPGRILKTVEEAGGKLIRWNKQGTDKVVVVWKSGGQTVNSLIDLDFRVLEAGYCLSGEDKRHSLGSIVPLAQIFKEQGRSLYLTRE